MREIDRRTVLALLLAFAVPFAVGDGRGQSIGQYIDDAMITSMLKARMSNDLGANQINVETRNGIVRLSGVAESRLALVHAEQLAWSIEGVKGVQNELKSP